MQAVIFYKILLSSPRKFVYFQAVRNAHSVKYQVQYLKNTSHSEGKVGREYAEPEVRV